jgi:hypothetical protein
MTEPEDHSEYEQARQRAVRKRKLRGELVDYVAINALLVGIWAATGFGYFWPGWVLAIWGVFLSLSWWKVLHWHELSEEDIRREMHHMR